MIMRMWTSWRDNPARIVLENTVTSTSAIPFPAITICPSQKIDDKYLNDDFLNRARQIVEAKELNQSEFLRMQPEE